MLIKYHTYGLVFGLVFSGLAWADEPAAMGCAAKLAAIGAELTEAKAAGNQHKVAGLEKAYDEVATHCDKIVGTAISFCVFQHLHLGFKIS